MKLQVACYGNPHISPTRTTTQGKQQTPLLSVCLKEKVSFIESLCSNAGDSHQSKVQSWSFKDCLCDSEPWLQVPSWSKIQAKMEANTHGICSILGFRYIPLSGFFPRFMIVPFTYIRSPKLRPLQDLKSLPQFQALAPALLPRNQVQTVMPGLLNTPLLVLGPHGSLEAVVIPWMGPRFLGIQLPSLCESLNLSPSQAVPCQPKT